MRLPRDLDGDELIAALRAVGYAPSRQSGSHVRLTARLPSGEHHVTVPRTSPLRVGTLNAILMEVASHLGIDRDTLIRRIL